MPWMDILIVSIIIAAGLVGFWSGFIQSAGALLGMIFSLFFAFKNYQFIVVWFTSITKLAPSDWWGIVAFVILFIVISYIISLIFKLIDKIFNIIAILPGLKTLNKVLGFLLGILQGIILINAILFIVNIVPLEEGIISMINKSNIIPFFNNFLILLSPFIPSEIRDTYLTSLTNF